MTDRTAEQQYETAARRLGQARVPQLYLERILAAIPAGNAVPPGRQVMPLDDTVAMLLARAFVARTPNEVRVGAGEHGIARFTGFERWLFLGGNVGAGKTLAACWIIANWRDWGFFARASAIAKLDDDLLGEAKRASLLVLDDLGDEYVGESQFGAVRIAELLTERHGNGLPTIATMNLKRSEFVARYGERTNDRLNELGKFIAIGGPSLRSAKR